MNSSDAIANTTGLILAGGLARRMGEQDKGLIVWNNKPLIVHVEQSLSPQVGEVLLSINRNQQQYAQLFPQRPQVTDLRDDFQGPLAGIEAAAQSITSDYLITVPCDMPRLPEDMVDRLLTPLKCEDVDVSFAQAAGRDYYLCMAIRTSILKTISTYLGKDRRAVRHWIYSQKYKAVDFSDRQEQFVHCNTPEELQNLGSL